MNAHDVNGASHTAGETSRFADGRSYRTSSFCTNGGCVGVSFLPDGEVAVADTKDPSRPALVYTRQEWTDFVAGVKNGEFDAS